MLTGKIMRSRKSKLDYYVEFIIGIKRSKPRLTSVQYAEIEKYGNYLHKYLDAIRANQTRKMKQIEKELDILISDLYLIYGQNNTQKKPH